MTLADVADRLLEHPTVRQFLLAFDEKEWPDVVQSTSALGIQALLAKYGQAVRVSDATMLRTLARNIARSGCWPASLKGPEECHRARSGGSRPVRRQSRLRRPAGRSLPPSAVRCGPRLGAASAMQVPSRPRGRSAPPEMGPILRSMMLQADVGSASSFSPVTAGSIGQQLPESKRKVLIAAQVPQAPQADIASNPSIGAGADVQGSEWYVRLMSKLQRLNPKVTSLEAAPKSTSGESHPGSRQQQLRQQLHMNVEGDIQAQAVTAREGVSRQPLRSDVSTDALLFSSTSRDPITNRQQLRQQLRLEVESEASSRPRTPPILLQAAETMEPESASVLLSALPSREDRREWHAVALHEGSRAVMQESPE